jgi:AcrR family transcriptional regulator
MTSTPWGRSENLRLRRSPPGPRSARPTASRNHRDRLLGAAVAAFAEKGYEATRVADILPIAGVSRGTFYKHFANKQACFLATLAATLELAGDLVAARYRDSEGSWQQRLESTLELAADIIVTQPAAARVALVEVYAAGPRAVELVEDAIDRAARKVRTALRESPERAELPLPMIRAIIGGVRRMVLTRLRARREHELPAMVPDLLEWALSYHTPSQQLRRWGRPPAAYAPNRPVARDARERILYAVTDLVVERGYPDTAISEIAERAAVSLSTFYDLFPGKEEAFIAALLKAQQRVIAGTLPAYASTDDWPQAIRASARAFLGMYATDPTASYLGTVEVWATGPAAFDVRSQGMDSFNALLDTGFDRYPKAPRAGAEAIGAAIDAMLFDELRKSRAERLYTLGPTGIFMVLAPFLGSEAATAVANEPLPRA